MNHATSRFTHLDAAEFGLHRTIRNSEAPSAASIAAPIEWPAASSSRSLKIGVRPRPSAAPFGAR
ncbi:MAG: hypothetical protein A3E01_12335 [Gammaproteobacteria bacterium RIFCSPHIGHO2_12_FULL_63_22]|nr:MAG: hypothetical protein A3E01_12335 [Gammaproteobacteria bacterium RIFCSPHIGHO2_12_FULL_63_22]